MAAHAMVRYSLRSHVSSPEVGPTNPARCLLPLLLLLLLFRAVAPLSAQPLWISFSEQQREKAALLALRESLNNHPALLTPPFNVSGNEFGVGPWVEDPPTWGGTSYIYNPCGPTQWAWIICRDDMRVLGIMLDGQSLAQYNSSWQRNETLTGRIDWEGLRVLKGLEIIYLANNLIGGTLEGMESLTQLQMVVLANNLIEGGIPQEMANLDKLVTLALNGNKLTGRVPTSLSFMPNLTDLNIMRNNLSGPLPPLVHTTNLTSLMLNDMSLEGPLPESWSALQELQCLRVDGLAGGESLPESWSCLTALYFFSCYDCGLSGEFPALLFESMRSMSYIDLAGNSLSGEIPAGIETLKGLTHLDLSGNYFQGLVPPKLLQHAKAAEVSWIENGGVLAWNLTENCLEGLGNMSTLGQRNESDCSEFYSRGSNITGSNVLGSDASSTVSILPPDGSPPPAMAAAMGRSCILSVSVLWSSLLVALVLTVKGMAR